MKECFWPENKGKCNHARCVHYTNCMHGEYGFSQWCENKKANRFWNRYKQRTGAKSNILESDLSCPFHKNRDYQGAAAADKMEKDATRRRQNNWKKYYKNHRWYKR